MASPHGLAHFQVMGSSIPHQAAHSILDEFPILHIELKYVSLLGGPTGPSSTSWKSCETNPLTQQFLNSALPHLKKCNFLNSTLDILIQWF